MEKILKEHCINRNHGLLLLSLPTGFGKTFNVLNFIYNNYKEFAQQKRKILFITNLKNNLPVKELRERFIKNGNEEEFHQYILFINSNSEHVIKHLLETDSEIPDQFKTEVYSRLRDYIKMYDNNQHIELLKSNFETFIRQDIEPEFRRNIQKKLTEIFPTKKARLEAIKNDRDYQWIGKLYPAVFTDERTVFFLSMDKFVVKNTTIIEPSYYFHERFIDRALIFIDEFDTTKESVLNNIIATGLKHRVDLLDLFLNIHNHLMQNECPAGLINESQWRKKKAAEKKWSSLEEEIALVRQEANEIFKKYNLHHTYKSYQELAQNQRNFLFYDYYFHHVLDRSKRIEINKDIQNRTNWINSVDINTTQSDDHITSLLGEINRFLFSFQRGIVHLADNYCYLKKEDENIQEDFLLENAIKTVLNQFHIDTANIQFLTDRIMEGRINVRLEADQSIFQGQGFYNTGFRYYDIVDSNEHDTLSKIYMFNFSRTPESFLAGVCSKAMVIGISATAGLYTNIGNYDIQYLKSCLGESFIQLEDETILQFKSAYAEATKGYDRINLKTKFIHVDSQKEAIKQLTEVLNDESAANSLWNRLQQKLKTDDEDDIQFCFYRYVRVLIAWKYFLDNFDCHAFLCIFSKFPKPHDAKFDLNILYEYAELLLSESQDLSNASIKDIITILNRDNFEANKKHLQNELKEGKRRFIISSYQTIGVGQNLQFPIPEGLETIHINNFPKSEEMDINGIYLDNPTNLLVNIFGDRIEDENLIKYIFQLEFLVENGAISPKTLKDKLDQAFRRYIGINHSGKSNEKSLYNTDAYSRFLNKIIMQAIGRICRTNVKSPNIHILADFSIQKHLIRFFLPKDVIPVREYIVLLESVNRPTEQSENLKELENLAAHKSNRASAYIRRKLINRWTPESIKEWQDLREQVLRQPVIVKELDGESRWNIIYLKLPSPANSYHYLEEYDYREMEVFFSNTYDKKEVKEVSQEAAYLTELMKIDVLSKLFINSGWATEFPQSELILSPPIFNNIYKGALGEVCGKHILEKFLKFELQDLDVDEFERFDFKISNNNDKNIYVDFKLWNDRIAIPANEIIDKILAKMADIGADCVFIINILATSDKDFHPTVSHEGKIIEIPYLCKHDRVDSNIIEFILRKYHDVCSN